MRCSNVYVFYQRFSQIWMCRLVLFISSLRLRTSVFQTLATISSDSSGRPDPLALHNLRWTFCGISKHLRFSMEPSCKFTLCSVVRLFSSIFQHSKCIFY